MPQSYDIGPSPRASVFFLKELISQPKAQSVQNMYVLKDKVLTINIAGNFNFFRYSRSGNI